jgi:hypothetical protein
MSNSIWMIERIIDGVPHWWIREPGQFSDWYDPKRWTTDPNKARKYNTKSDAEFVIGNAKAPMGSKTDMSGCIATEHVFMDSQSE